MRRRTPKHSTWWKNLLLALGSVLVFFTLMEGALRLAGYGDVVLYDLDPEAFWVLRPNQHCRTKVGAKELQVDEHGYRGASFPARKPTGGRRLFAFGDSVTFGWGVADDEGYPARLEQLLRRDGTAARVVNAGVNAYALFQEEVAFRNALRFSPDAAIFSSTQNEYWQDLQFLDEAERRRVETAVLWKNGLRRLALYHAFGELQLTFLYSRLSRRLTQEIHGGRPADIGPRKEKYAETLMRIRENARQAGVPIAFLILPKSGQTELDPLQEVMSGFARDNAIPLVDLVSGSGPPPDGSFLEKDTVHPTAAYHEEIARKLEPTVLALLGS